jgi:tRNA pseudouridine38-40 synthase
MNRYFIEISFRGTRYHGWQIQPNATSVQMILEEKLGLLTGRSIRTTGAGRTDTGVHARHFTAHFEDDHPLFESAKDCLYKLNSVLPDDISANDLYRVHPDIHARFSAISRAYEYRISQTRDPFDTEFSWYFSRPLDIQSMNLAAVKLMEYTDFTSFSKLHTDVKTNLCHITQAVWTSGQGKLVFRVQADRFLRNMVRSIVGTMIEIGLGSLDIQGFTGIIEGKNRNLAGFSVPARGLSLIDITYPQNIRL